MIDSYKLFQKQKYDSWTYTNFAVKNTAKVNRRRIEYYVVKSILFFNMSQNIIVSNINTTKIILKHLNAIILKSDEILTREISAANGCHEFQMDVERPLTIYQDLCLWNVQTKWSRFQSFIRVSTFFLLCLKSLKH